jgi:hypothetical protein
MLRKLLSARGVIPVIMCLQVVPLLMFPLSTYTIKNQEWWLPVLLTFLVIISLVQIFIRRAITTWPWYLLSFAQGINIISRIMMLMPHATVNMSGTEEINGTYIVISVISMLLSVFEIWYNDLPEVRRKILAA